MNNVHLRIIGSDSFSSLLNELDLNYKISINSDTENNGNLFLVRVIFAEEVQLTKLKKFSHDNVPTIFLLNNKNFLIINKLRLLDFHVCLILPVEILSLREIINILLTKYNFFKKSKVVINNYEIDSNQRIIIKDGIKTKLTERELELILTLNKNNGQKKNFLLKKIWNHNSDLESHAFETHLHRLRKKIDKFFKDKEFIVEKNSLYYLTK